ncbi:hypothetical protein Tco_1328698 [Tanacetum coccineum]
MISSFFSTILHRDFEMPIECLSSRHQLIVTHRVTHSRCTRQVVDGPKKVQFALGNDTRSHENEHGVNNRVEVSAAPSHEVNEQNLHSMDVDISSRSNDEISSLLAKGTT